MFLENQKPETAYRTKFGGKNYIIVDEIFIYEDKCENSIVLQNNCLRKHLFKPHEHKSILSEKEGFYDWQDDREMVLKQICCKYRFIADYLIFNAADESRGKVLNCEEVLGEDINSDMYKCTPWTYASLYFGK